MKRVKIMLTAITVLAVVGGALAFKARTFASANVYCDSTCPDNSKVLFTTGNNGSTTTTTDPCDGGAIYKGLPCIQVTDQPTTTITFYSAPNL